MPYLTLLLVSVVSGALVAAVTRLLPLPAAGSHTPSRAPGERLGQTLRGHRRLSRQLRDRLDPATATGLALTIGSVLIIGGGVLLGLLAYQVRTDSGLVRADRSVGQWGVDNATDASTRLLQATTHLGDTVFVAALAVVVAIVAYVRLPNRWIVPFIAVVVIGQNLITNGLKDVLDRVRPTFNPIAETLGPSFPSGHTAAAAAFYAAAALLLGRRSGPTSRALLAGGAVAIAVGVACTRVLLGVHWLSDVIGGLALGWGWFALCSIAFGGRLLHFGAPMEDAMHAAEAANEPAAARR